MLPRLSCRTAQSVVIELCDLLDVPRPHATAEQAYMFERPVTFRHGDGSTSAATNPAHTFTAPGQAPATFAVTLTVTNAQGLTNQAALSISANNSPPQVAITSPAAGTRYPLTANTEYNLRATVTDDQSSGHLLSYAK